MDHTAIKQIAEMSAPNFKEINGRIYSDKGMKLITEPCPQPITVRTLGGLVSIVRMEYNKVNSPLFVNVHEYDNVSVFSTLRANDMQREHLCFAKSETSEFLFGRYFDYENMIIALRTQFVQAEETEYLISLLANITDEQSVQTLDDGITQNAVVRKGINLKEHKNIKPIVKLKPYRTFLEVEQPESEFLFRLKEGTAALYEADGGAWKLTARKNIAEYLRQELSELIEEGKVIVIE